MRSSCPSQKGHSACSAGTGTGSGAKASGRSARPGARVVLAGIPSGDQTTFWASIARRKGITLVLVRRMKEVYPRALRLAEAGAVDLQSLVTHRFPIDRAPEAFEVAVAREGLKDLRVQFLAKPFTRGELIVAAERALAAHAKGGATRPQET